MKHVFLFLVAFVCMLFAGCSDDSGMETAGGIASSLVDEYYERDDGMAFRFNTDGTFLWASQNHMDSYRWSIPDIRMGKWSVEGDNITLIWDEEDPGYAPQKAPILMLNVSFAKGRMVYTDEKGTTSVLEQHDISTIISQDMIGYTFKAGISYSLGGINYHAVHTLILKEDNTAEWSLVCTAGESEVERYRYSGFAYYITNLSEDEVYFQWFFDNGEAPELEVLSPPYYLIDLRHETGPDGQWLLYFDGGYSGFANTNFVRK